MPKKLLCVLLALFCLCCSSCSAVSNLLDKAGAGDLKEKLDTAWSEVGREAVGEMADNIWREYGFGKSLDWPDSGNGAYIPKFRDGVTEYSFSSDDGKCGCVRMSDVTKDKYDKYITDLQELGYGLSLTVSQLDEVYVCDGLYIGLLKSMETLYICYGESVAELDDVYDAASSQQEE